MVKAVQQEKVESPNTQGNPPKYKVTHTHLLFEKCELDYGGKFVLKDNEGEK